MLHRRIKDNSLFEFTTHYIHLNAVHIVTLVCINRICTLYHDNEPFHKFRKLRTLWSSSGYQNTVVINLVMNTDTREYVYLSGLGPPDALAHLKSLCISCFTERETSFVNNLDSTSARTHDIILINQDAYLRVPIKFTCTVEARRLIKINDTVSYYRIYAAYNANRVCVGTVPRTDNYTINHLLAKECRKDWPNAAPMSEFTIIPPRLVTVECVDFDGQLLEAAAVERKRKLTKQSVLDLITLCDDNKTSVTV